MAGGLESLVMNIGRFAPDADPLKPLYEARQRGRLGDLRNVVSEQMGMEDPNKQLMLGSLAQVDPVRAMQMGGFDATKQRGGRPITGNFAEMQRLRMQAEPLELELNQVAQQAIGKITQDINANITQEQANIADLTTKIRAITGKPPKSILAGKLAELIRLKAEKRAERGDVRSQEALEQSQAEYAHRLTQDEEKDMTGQVATWKVDNKDLLNRQKLMQIAKGFAQQAPTNPIAAKNLLAITSRLGSNEALSDGEMSIMISGNLTEKMERSMDKMFGSGASIGTADVSNAIATLDSLGLTLSENMGLAIKQGLKNIKVITKDAYSDDELTGLMRSGILGKYIPPEGTSL